MKLFFFGIFSLIIFSCSTQKEEIYQVVRAKQLLVQNLEEAQDFKRLKEELVVERKDVGPFTYGIFPYPDYDSIRKNTFSGIGTYGNFYGENFNGKKIIYKSFGENKSPINQFRVKDKDRIFFTIVVLTDFIDEKNFTSSQSQIVSRNFPDVIGQGYVRTTNNKIDFSSFITLENDEFAIINMKLYNLKYGNVILISPQKDGSLRSFQIREKQNLNSETLKNYILNLLKENIVIKFFTEGNPI